MVAPNGRKPLRSAMLSVKGSRGILLLIASLALFVTAAFMWNLIAGFATAGLALSYLEWRTS